MDWTDFRRGRICKCIVAHMREGTLASHQHSASQGTGLFQLTYLTPSE